MSYKEIKGDLIAMAKEGRFDVIVHGCNCFCTMGAGIAPQMAKAFGVDQFSLERRKYYEDINKLGQIDWGNRLLPIGRTLSIVNAYTQYHYGHKYGVPIDYDALTLCMRKINHVFKGKHIGLPQIGCGLAAGDWNIVKNIIITELKDMEVSVIIYKP
jgi:O-acetyl-ADP-ribose deacetylase (regulator of RNase III)